MRRTVALLLTGILVVGVSFAMQGCAGKDEEMEDLTAQQEMDEAGALAGEDLALHEQPDDVIYVEATSREFEDVQFDFDRYDIRPRDEATLSGIASWLNEHANVDVLIEGHCDERGTNEYNMALGEQRALAARRYLIGLGIGTARLSTISYGEERPFDHGSSESAWAANRRAHFAVSQ